ncbi:proteasome regulatory particle base subunit RPN10 [Sugiyamaella lignohabitans]|uniref:Proteasome regulatory particle base subunit RPN10 n=1 Tax=Sugiyamaella lignohabitans TaxID=796027 RepID=A0A167CR66_9ASCO|nr:proteasome regulatory particle base subunit RPN10 [Sugiyamaella lignohabitans]ANB12010.1 proteasome regulatory particle base subunit RPN10 [Sugiyamaella lignohabitans]
MTLGGNGPEVKVTLCSEFGKILAGIHDTTVHGTNHLATSIQVAALALKHRQNKIQRQRVVVFVGSPIKEDSKELIKLAKKMKKNNVAVDFVNFGEEAENTEKLESFIEQVNSSDNSHLVTIPPGPHLLSDVLASSPIINEDSVGGGIPGGLGAGSGGAGAGSSSELFEFGVDPSVDPELALALRMSLEDEKARQEKEKEKAAASSSAAATIPEETASEVATAEASSSASAAPAANTEATNASEEAKESEENKPSQMDTSND